MKSRRFEEPDDDDDGSILVRGLYLVGAAWDHDKNLVIESPKEETYCKMPVLRLAAVPEEEEEGSGDDEDDHEEGDGKGGEGHMYECPLFQNSEKTGEDNFVISLDLPTEEAPERWILRGVTLMSQPPKEVN